MNNQTVIVNDAPPKPKPEDLPSKFFKVVPSTHYNPPPKPLSRRDLWRAEVKERKYAKNKNV